MPQPSRRVRQTRRHDVIRVSDGGDPASQRNVAVRCAIRIAGTVPPLVVIGCCPQPIAEPTFERLQNFDCRRRMLAQQVPFGVGRLARFVENLWRDRQLSDVVQERPPTEAVQILVGQSHLLTNDVGIGTNAFGVPAGEGFVSREVGDQLHRLFCCGLC